MADQIRSRGIEAVLDTGHVLPGIAYHWTDGHILGNGDVGAVVYGTPDDLCIGVSKHDVNDLRHPSEHGSRPEHTYPELRERVMNGDRTVLSHIRARESADPYSEQPLSCGRLCLGLLRSIQPKSFSQSLSFRNAEVIVDAMPAVGWRGVGVQAPQSITVRVLVPSAANMVLVELKSRRTWRISWSYDRILAQHLNKPEFHISEDGTVGIMRHGLPLDMGYAVAISHVGGEFQASASEYGLMGEIGFGGDLGDCWLILSVVSSVEVPDQYPERARELVQGLDAEAVADLLHAHRQRWDDFWSRSSVSYEHKSIEQLWVMGLYALASATRPDKSPPHLQGIWVQDELAPWHADFHMNTNIQECHWVACPSNHPELQEALVRVLTRDWREELRRYARECFGARGIAVPLCCDWLGRAIGCSALSLEVSLAAWVAQHVWQQYAFTLDRDLLAQDVYPFLRECCDFYFDISVKDGDRYTIELSHSPEQMWFDDSGNGYLIFGRNPAIDIAAIRKLLIDTIDAAEALGLGQDPHTERCREVLHNLPELPVQNGILIDYETAFFHDGDRPGFLPWCHRHPSRLMAVFPAGLIGLHSDDSELQLARNSFLEFHERYGNHLFTGWSLAYQACIAARLGMASAAEECLSGLHDYYCFKGLLTSHNSFIPGLYNHSDSRGPLFQIDALLGAAAAVNEMLLQRTPDGLIRVFPAVPAGRCASFTDLRVPGAVLVSAARDATGVCWVSVLSEREGEVALANPWPGRAPEVDPDIAAQIRFDKDRISWFGSPGLRVDLSRDRITRSHLVIA